jgi:hypothetical protein
MKLGIISESEANEAALRILIPALVSQPVEIIEPARARPGGWSAALNAVPVEMRHLYYRTDADGLIIVVDSDDLPVHTASHEQTSSGNEGCRACRFLTTIRQVQSSLSARPIDKPFTTAFGLAVLTIEAWLLCGVDIHATEAHFVRELQSRPRLRDLRLELKRQIYGSDRPAREIERTKAIEHATRLAGSLDLLRRHFPDGFGLLERTLTPLRR